MAGLPGARLGCNVVTLPRLAGTRAAAVELTAKMPAMGGLDVAFVDAGANRATAQGFVDELVHQVLFVKDWGRLVVTKPSPKLAGQLTAAAARRGVAGRLVLR